MTVNTLGGYGAAMALLEEAERLKRESEDALNEAAGRVLREKAMLHASLAAAYATTQLVEDGRRAARSV